MRGEIPTKKWFSIPLCLMLTVIYAVPASANSGPSRFESPPAYGIAPVKDCPITVESEDLTFQGMNQYANYSKISAYEDALCKKKLSTVPQLTVTQTSPKKLCMQCIANDYQIKESLAQSIALGYMDNTLAQAGFCDMEAVGNIDKVNRIYLLNYTVPFEANSEQNVSVSYTTVPSMQEDKDFTTNTFAYLSNPAKNWASFRNLNVTVIPPSKDYTLASSTIDLKADSSGNYKASLSTLPQNDIAFALHTKKSVNALASVYNSSVLWWIPIIGIVLILAIVAALLYRKKRRKVDG